MGQTVTVQLPGYLRAGSGHYRWILLTGLLSMLHATKIMTSILKLALTVAQYCIVKIAIRSGLVNERSGSVASSHSLVYPVYVKEGEVTPDL